MPFQKRRLRMDQSMKARVSERNRQGEPLASVRRQQISLDYRLPELDAGMQPVHYTPEHIRERRRDIMDAEREKDREMVKPVADSFGLRASLATAVLVVALAVVLGIVGTSMWNIHMTQKRIAQITERIESMETQCEALKTEYEEAVDSANIAKSAVELGMVAATHSNTVKLYPPENAVLTPQGVRAGEE